jgi:hypothetical protein
VLVEQPHDLGGIHWWCPCLHSRFQDNPSSLTGALLGAWMWAEDDCVTGLQTDEALEDCSAGRVGGRDDTTGLVILLLVEDILG